MFLNISQNASLYAGRIWVSSYPIKRNLSKNLKKLACGSNSSEGWEQMTTHAVGNEPYNCQKFSYFKSIHNGTFLDR